MVVNDLFGATMPLHQFIEEFQCCSFVSPFRDNGFQHLTFVINGPPKIMPLAIYLHKDLVHMPLPFGVGSKLLNTLSSGLRSKHRTKPVPTVSWLTSMPRSCSRSSTFRSESGKRMYNITARRMISGLVLKYLKEAGLVMGKSYATPLPHSRKVLLTRPFRNSSCKGRSEWQ